MKISIIIPTLNKPTYLNRVLASLLSQDYSKPYEVIVVDDYNGDDKAERVCNFWKNDIRVRYVKVSRYKSQNGRAVARNLGIQKSRGDLLIFLDDDMIVPPFFISEHEKAHQQKNRVVIGYRFYLRPSYRFLEYINPINLLSDPNIISCMPQAVDERDEIYKICNDDLDKLPAPWVVLYSNNFSVSKELIQSVDGFEENFQYGWGGEDVELGYKLYKLGANFFLNRKAFGYHQWHHNNLKKNVASLQNNLKNFYSLHTSLDVELYLEYLEIGLKNYLMDLKRFKSCSKNISCFQKIDKSFLNSTEKMQFRNSLLIGWDKNLAELIKPSACIDIRMNESLRKSNGLDKCKVYGLLGIHTPFSDNEFDGTIINGNVWSILRPYHVRMMVDEALRISKNIVIYLPSKIFIDRFKQNVTTLERELLIKNIGKELGLLYHKNLEMDCQVSMKDIVIRIAKKEAPKRMSNKSLILNNRIVFVFTPFAEENFNNNVFELALALDRSGCDVCFEVEDPKTELIVANAKKTSLKKYFSEHEWLQIKTFFGKNIEGVRKHYPRLSLTGRFHHYGKIIEWFHPNYVGALPSYQIYMLNHGIDLVWCTCQEIRDSYLKSGGDSRKIHNINTGVNWKLADHLWNSRQQFPRAEFTFLAIGTVARRDGIDLLVRAFCDEFKKDRNIKLLIKLLPLKLTDFHQKKGLYNSTVKNSSRKYAESTHAMQKYRLEEWKNILRQYGVESSRCRIVHEHEGLRRWVEYYKDGDCYVQSHRADLVGDRVMQAMAAGIPVIATKQYLADGLCTPQNSYSIASRQVPAVMDEWSGECIYSKWAEPNIQYLKRVMRHVVQNKKEAFAKSRHARKDVVEKWNWEEVAKKVINSLESLNDVKIGGSDGRLSKLFLELFNNNLLGAEEESIERK